MRRADRLFQIVQLLRGGRLVTASHLAERLEVSKRTIYRDIADLVGSGVPIDGEAGVGYIMREGYHMPPLMFNAEEIVALVAGARLLQSFGGAKMALSAEDALGKIQAVLPEAMKAHADKVSIHAFNPMQTQPETKSFLDRLETAERDRIKVEIVYQDAETQETRRLVRPLALWFWGKVWTLIAWCEMREDFRMFRVDRIQALTEMSPFRPEPEKSLKAFLSRELCETSSQHV